MCGTMDILRINSHMLMMMNSKMIEQYILQKNNLDQKTTPVIPPKRGRASTQQLLAVAANTCTPITNFIIDSKRKRESADHSPPEEQDQPQKLIKKGVTPVDFTSSVSTELNDTVIMEKILEELKDMRTDQAKKHKELTDKLNKKLKDDEIAFDGIQKNLDSLRNELQDSKTDLNKRIEALKKITNEIIKQLNSRIDSLERENKKTKISIVGLSLTSNNHAEEIKIFLESKFEECIPSISLIEFTMRLIVDLEREIDWNVRQLIKQLRTEGKNCIRKGNKVLVDDLVYSWSEKANKMLSQLKKNHAHSSSMVQSGNFSKNSLIGNLDIIATCKTWVTQPYSPGFLENFNTYWSKALREHAVGRASGGLLTAIIKQHDNSLIDASPWWIFNEIQLGSSVAILGSVYLHKCLDFNYLLETLQGTIDDIKATRSFDLFIIGGDMNAKVGLLNPWPADLFAGYQILDTFRTTDDSTCERGRKIMDFMVENDFVLINGKTISDSPAQPTFDCSGSSIIDLIWIDISSLHVVNDLEVLLETSLSDHHPVCLSISLETFIQPDKNENVKSARLVRINWSENAADQYLE
ncbi:Protein of unknown function [Cotesia congregata]|uniref:Endonuclease/exonuclease/phosphatase domain-containing protein n=1 Tax=Cotesia congregata TaxID=51543 RepID=A0A8J2MQ21_COTCN|nr:Protein of unknown function [Cotesia congregata]